MKNKLEPLTTPRHQTVMSIIARSGFQNPCVFASLSLGVKSLSACLKRSSRREEALTFDPGGVRIPGDLSLLTPAAASQNVAAGKAETANHAKCTNRFLPEFFSQACGGARGQGNDCQRNNRQEQVGYSPDIIPLSIRSWQASGPLCVGVLALKTTRCRCQKSFCNKKSLKPTNPLSESIPRKNRSEVSGLNN